MTEPFDLVFDETGTPHVPASGVALLRAQLGHDPHPGETVSVALVDDGDQMSDIADDVIDNWLRTEVLPSIQEVRADPSKMIPAEVVYAELDELHAQWLAAGR